MLNTKVGILFDIQSAKIPYDVIRKWKPLVILFSKVGIYGLEKNQIYYITFLLISSEATL